MQRLAVTLGALDDLLKREAFPRRYRRAVPDEHGVLHPQLCATLGGQQAREECVEADVRFDSSCVRYFLLLSNRYVAKAQRYGRHRNCDRVHEYDTYLSGLGVEDEAGDGDRRGLFHEPDLGHLSDK